MVGGDIVSEGLQLLSVQFARARNKGKATIGSKSTGGNASACRVVPTLGRSGTVGFCARVLADQTFVPACESPEHQEQDSACATCYPGTDLNKLPATAATKVSARAAHGPALPGRGFSNVAFRHPDCRQLQLPSNTSLMACTDGITATLRWWVHGGTPNTSDALSEQSSNMCSSLLRHTGDVIIGLASRNVRCMGHAARGFRLLSTPHALRSLQHEPGCSFVGGFWKAPCRLVCNFPPEA